MFERWSEESLKGSLGFNTTNTIDHIRDCYAELDRLEAQLEAVKRLLKAWQEEGSFEIYHATQDCLAVGIDPKEL